MIHIPRVVINRDEVRRALFPTESGPIIKERSQNDWYCYSMGHLASRNHRDVQVGYRFFNRSKKIRLADEINPTDLERELNHVKGLSYIPDELAYFRNIRNDGAFMFSDDYLEDLRMSKLPDYHLDVEDGQFEFDTTGRWHEAIDWEMSKLTIISALRTEALMKKKTKTEQDEVVEYTARALEDKINFLRKYPDVTFSDFGTRRAASPLMQDLVVKSMLEYLKRGQFVGTSNVSLARKYQTMATGTTAHQRDSILAALTMTDQELLEAPIKGLRQWFAAYGWGLSVMLPDCFGSDWMFENLPAEFATQWKGMRQDSMDMYEFGEKQIAFYEKHGQDPRERLLIPSDGLDMHSMIRISRYFQNRIKVSSGWGTQLTNDTSLGHPSIVVKAVTANGRSCVKLSDNIAKAIGAPEEIERYKRVFNYRCKHTEQPVC